MNKKKIFLSIFILLLFSSALFAYDWSLGMQGGWTPAFETDGIDLETTDVALSLKLPSVPVIFTWDAAFHGYNIASTTIMGDWWFNNPTLVKDLHYYYALGAAIALRFPDYSFYSVDIGARAVLGLNMYLYEPFEVYTQLALQPSLAITKEGLGFIMQTPLSVGFRLWF